MEVRRHVREIDRLTSVESYRRLGAETGDPCGIDGSLEALARLAARVCQAPTALISLVGGDRQWILSSHGWESGELARSESVCSDVDAADGALVVADLAGMSRYAGLGWVRGPGGFRAYAGVPLVGRDGLPVGAVCVLDRAVRGFTAADVAALADLAGQVMTVLDAARCDVRDGLTAVDLIAEARSPRVLRTALDRGEFVAHFQPVVDLDTGAVRGLEALLRWEHPTRGLLTPQVFLPGLQTGCLVGWVGRAMVRAACALTVELQARGITLPGGVAVNITAGQLSTPGLAAEFLAVLSEHGLPGSALVVELTETSRVDDLTVAREQLRRLRGGGVRVVADDFGVGWSNLTRLLELPFAGLKLDRTLVTGMVGDPVRDHMVAAAVSLAATLGVEVTAEGVETEAVRHRLLELGCYRGQGWLFSAAVPAGEVPALITGLGLHRSRPQPTPAGSGSRESWVGRWAAVDSGTADPGAAAPIEVGQAAPDLLDGAGMGTVSAVEAELADLECRRYTDRRGIVERAQQLLATARTHSLPAQAGRARLILADEASRGADVSDGVETARTILLRARAEGALTVAARSEAVIAWALDRMGARGEALTHAVEAVRLLPADGPPHLVVDHRMILALFNAQQTTDDSYVAMFDAVLADAERLGNPHLLLSVLNNYAWTLWDHGHPAAAVRLITRLQAAAAAAGIALNSTMLDTVASVLLDTGDLDDAEAAGWVMVDSATPDAEVRAAPEALLTLARIQLRRGRREQALTLVVRAEALAVERELPDVIATATLDKSRLLAQAGDHAGAYAALSVSHTTWVRVRDREADARAASLQALFETEQARQRSALFEELAERDALTGLWNRRHLDRVLPTLLTESHLTATPLSVAILDVDHFKRINDERNHHTGDAVLARLGELLHHHLPEPGFTARLGGEEFLLVMPATRARQAHDRCEQTRLLIGGQHWDQITDGVPVTVSIGHATATLTAPPATTASLLGAADTALYTAKHRGRDQVQPATTTTHQRKHQLWP